MSCLPEEMLSAHLDGDLTGDEARHVEAHLDGCAGCRATRESLGALRSGLAALSDVEPSRDLWPEVSIRHNERRPRWRWTWPAVAVLAATAALLFVLVPREPSRVGEPKLARAYASVVAAEQTYMESITALEEVVGDEAVATLSPEARTAIEQGLAQIDETIHRCKGELDAVPHDLGAHRSLLAAYQRKVDLLTELVDRSM